MRSITSITMILLLLCSATCFSQVRFGIKAGFNMASLPGDYPNGVENESLAGFHAGGTLDYKLASKISLLAEVLISTQGGKTDYSPNPFESQKQDIKLTNLNIPVFFRYQIIDKLSVEAGPQIGFVLAATNKIIYVNSADPSENETIKLDGLNDGTFTSDGMTYAYKKGINSVDVSVNLGVTYSIVKNFYVQARYNRGLTDVDLNSTVGTSSNSLNLRNSVVQLSAGYLFN